MYKIEKKTTRVKIKKQVAITTYFQSHNSDFI